MTDIVNEIEQVNFENSFHSPTRNDLRGRPMTEVSGSAVSMFRNDQNEQSPMPRTRLLS